MSLWKYQSSFVKTTNEEKKHYLDNQLVIRSRKLFTKHRRGDENPNFRYINVISRKKSADVLESQDPGTEDDKIKDPKYDPETYIKQPLFNPKYECLMKANNIECDECGCASKARAVIFQ